VARKAILVVGMHRSGTSALAGVLVHLGAAAPRTLLPPAVDNPLGFWESAPFCQFNDRLLRAGHSEWDLWSPFVSDDIPSEVLASFEREFGTLFEQEFGDTGLFLIKDPRMCKLMPFWLHSLRVREIDIGVVLALRYPFEVAQSLARRDGITAEHALLQWLRHVLESEKMTRDTTRTIVQYDELLADWRAVASRIGSQLDIDWPSWGADTASAIDAFVQPAMRHHIAQIDALEIGAPLLQWVTDAWSALQRLRGDLADRHAALATFNRIQIELDHVSPVFERVVEDDRRRHRAKTRDLQAAHSAEIARVGEQTAAVEWERDQLRGQVTFLEREFEQLRGHAHRVETEASRSWNATIRLTAEVDVLRQHVRNLSRRAEEAERDIEALHRSMSWRLTAPLRAVLSAWRRLQGRTSHDSSQSTVRGDR
jgi:hypothetical protein